MITYFNQPREGMPGMTRWGLLLDDVPAMIIIAKTEPSKKDWIEKCQTWILWAEEPPRISPEESITRAKQALKELLA